MGKTIAIIGDGAMPTICAKLLAGKGHTLRLYSAFPDNAARLAETRTNERYLPGVELPGELAITTDPGEALDGADLAIAAMPTQF
ncbi:hypothetical protein LCGC14_3141680, partial [marine sediment metagenome]